MLLEKGIMTVFLTYFSGNAAAKAHPCALSST
jgi:hypothetical protein